MKETEDRRSVRKYLDKDVADDDIRRLLESARLAPSGSNTQPWRFIVVRNQQTKQALVSADHEQKWMLGAPVFIVCVADMASRAHELGDMDIHQLDLREDSSLPELKLIIRDTAVAIEHILLEAVHLGLDCCWTGWFSQEAVRPVLGIPGSAYVCGIVTVGYGAEKPAPRPRLSYEDIVRLEKW